MHTTSNRNKTRRAVAAFVMGATVLGCLGVLVEFLYAQHYFAISYWLYQIKSEYLFWDNLHFAFFVDSGKTESTILVAIVLGLAGSFTWRCVRSECYARGLGLAVAGTFTGCYIASNFTRQATFSELLLLVTIQMLVVTVFCSFFHPSGTLRFATRDLLLLSIIVAFYLVAPKLIDQHNNSIGAIILLDRGFYRGSVNSFTPMLGLSAGLTTVAFLSRPMERFRIAYLFASGCVTVTLGYGVAIAFESIPAMQWGRGNFLWANYSITEIRYSYIALFPLSGFIALALVKLSSTLWQRCASTVRVDGVT